MELLIPGLILVALMVYVSTRIKRSAAGAFEPEFIDAEKFSVTKPAGFIIIESDEPDVLFAAYSKEYGADDADTLRQVSVEVRIHRGKTLEQVSIPIKQNAARVVDERHLAGPAAIIEIESERSGVPIECEYHLIESEGDVLEFSVTALSETKALNLKEIDEIISSFEAR